MVDTKKLRRLAQATNEHSDDRAEILAEFYAATQSDTIIELLDRLEAAEKERDWLPVPEKHPTFDPVDLQLSDGSVLCGCVPQSDGDYWWKGPSGEVFIDPKYASVTHWRLAATPKPEGK